MHNHFKINVAKRDGLTFDKKPRFVHFFATEVRDWEPAKAVYEALRSRFDAADYEISVTEWRASGRDVQM